MNYLLTQYFFILGFITWAKVGKNIETSKCFAFFFNIRLKNVTKMHVFSIYFSIFVAP